MTKNSDRVRNLLWSLDGAVIPGGCDLCDAEQEMRNNGNGVFILEIKHDDNCPTLKRRDER